MTEGRGDRPATARARLRRIGTIALPIMGAMVSQNVFNLVDAAMVGVLGAASLAAVGVASYANFMAMAAVMGLASGVQVMVARRMGEGRHGETAAPLTGGLILAIALGMPIAVVAFLITPLLFPYLNSDPAVVADGVPYLQARLAAVAAVGCNFAFRGYWAGVDSAGIYLRTVIVMHAINIGLNYVLIFGALGMPALGTQGAGIGSAIATWAGTAIHLIVGFRLARTNGFLIRVPQRETMVTMLRLALPSALQTVLFAAGITMLFAIIGRIGTAEVAVSMVIVTLFLTALLPGLALGLATLTLVGESLGRGAPGDARAWAWDVSRLAVLLLSAMGLAALAAPDLLLSGFVHDPLVREVGWMSLRLAGLAIVVEALAMVLQNALLGAGAARQVMVVAVGFQWLVGLPAAWLFGPYLGYGLLAVWLCHFAHKVLVAGTFVVLWRRGHWARIKV